MLVGLLAGDQGGFLLVQIALEEISLAVMSVIYVVLGFTCVFLGKPIIENNESALTIIILLLTFLALNILDI